MYLKQIVAINLEYNNDAYLPTSLQVTNSN